MSLTPQDLATNALKKIGAVAAGETPDFNTLNDAYTRLNEFLDLMATQKLTINGIQKFSINGISGHNPYTIGPAGDFNQARPIWVPVVTITLPGTIPADLTLSPISAEGYAEAIVSKTTQSQVPEIFYYDQAGPPKGNLYLWPILNDATVLLNIWVPVALVQFTSLTQSITLLPGYQAMLEWNLAADLLPEWGRVDPETVQMIMGKAESTMGWIKRANMAPQSLKCDPGLLHSNAVNFGGWYVGP